MSTEDETARLLRRTPLHQLWAINTEWFHVLEDRRSWFDILKLNHWTVEEWSQQMSREDYEDWCRKELIQ